MGCWLAERAVKREDGFRLCRGRTIKRMIGFQRKGKLREMLLTLLVMAGLLGMLSACEETKQQDGLKVQVYYLSNSETKVEIHEYDKPMGTMQEQINILTSYLSAIPEKPAYKSPLAMGFGILNMQYQDGGLVINVDKKYMELSATTEVLVRAAIVRTMLQADGIQRVQIQVDGSPLVDASGETVGWMTADQFIHSDGSEINSYEQVRVKLYFANESGDKLIAAYREKFYSTNTPLERFVVDEILAGPSGKITGLYPTVNSDTKILSVMTKDGICYLNFDSNFLSTVGNVTLDTEIYSIVNSLTELQGVKRVQILVNGEVPDIFGNAMFERNLDLVTVIE